jgi:hypothetical protein
MTEEKLEEISFQLEASPKKSLCLLALQCGLAKSTAHVGRMLLKLWPYKLQSYIAFFLLTAK